jgi:shikimate kinase
MSLENIILIGFMGSGKSSVGRRVAKKCGRHFADTDEAVVKNAGMAIADIFKTHGEPHFRELEHAALDSLCRHQEPLVIATGGGIVTRPENIPLLRRHGFVVWLSADEKTIWERVSQNWKRPLLHTPNPRETVSALLAGRRPLYEAAAQWTVETSGRSREAIADEIIAAADRYFSAA